MHLAQVNIARARAPLDSPSMAPFMAGIDELNALADRSAGFVWRFKDESGHATYVRPFEDKHILFNMSVWQTIEHLRDYAYRSAHAQWFRRRHDWFEPLGRPSLALWWVPIGHRPPVEEGIGKLAHLERNGPTPAAFTFKSVFLPLTLTVRPFADADSAAVQALWTGAFPNDPPRNDPARMIARKLQVQPELFLVATLDEILVGAVMAGYDGVRGWIHHLAVASEWRRRGVATALVREAESGLARLGCPKVNLQVRTTNSEVVAFYRKLGYAVEDLVSLGRVLE